MSTLLWQPQVEASELSADAVRAGTSESGSRSDAAALNLRGCHAGSVVEARLHFEP
jgi:hypothetical protein